ncbi:MAG: UbiA family prenyltransferase [Anditalea sp.]
MAILQLKKIYAYLQSLSIDIVLGACAGMLFFDRLIEAELDLVLYILLGLAVWCIYTFDHLLDAKQIGKQASTFRHSFHQEHFKTISFLLILIGGIGLGAAFYMLHIKYIIIYGLGLGILILLVFIFLKIVPGKWAFIKEISIATLYVGGIMLAPFFHNVLGEMPHSFWLLGIAYVLVAWFNTIYLGILDRESDYKDGLYSLALSMGESRSKKILYVLLAIMLAYIISLYVILNSFAYFHISLILIIALIHGIAFLKAENNNDAVRRKLDASFMLPFLLLLV